MAGDALPPRPRSLPLAPVAPPARRHLPLLDEVRDLDREARPFYAVWELTLRCDLACRHCGSRAGRARPEELTTAEALDVVRQLAELGCREVTLIGGEAYLHEGWTAVGRAIREAGMDFTLVTGGRGMDAERARLVREAGAHAVGVSVDALEELHDALRGVQGAYRSAFEAIANLKREGVSVSANSQITAPALRQLEPLMERLMDAGIERWQVSMTVPMGRAADEPALLLQPYQVLEVLPLVARITERARARNVSVSPGNDIGYFGPYEELLRGDSEQGYRLACTAGRLGLGLEADGSLKGCPSLPSRDYVGGNVRDRSLRELWERAEPLRFTRGRTAEGLWGYCRECYYAEDCLGGCSWTAHVLFGRIGNNPYCHHRALELLSRGLRERVVQTQKPPGEPFDYGLFECVLEPWPEGELERARAVAEGREKWLTD